MSTLGLRLGWAALKILKTDIQGATYFAQTCACDGIRLALKFEDLQTDDQAQHLLRIFDKQTLWQIELLPETLSLAATYRQLATDDERAALLEKLRSIEEASLLSVMNCGEIV
jgi:hypothetical protein